MNVHQSISDQLFDLVGNTMAVFMVYPLWRPIFRVCPSACLVLSF